MAYDPQVLRRATEILEQQRREHQLKKAHLRLQAYDRQPRLEQLDRQLQGTMAQLMAAALRRGENPVDAIHAIRDENLAIQQERRALLNAMGLAEDALDDTPLCAVCKDSGWVGARMCECLKQICGAEQIRELSKLLDLGSQSFENFRMDYYSTQPLGSGVWSPREQMKMIHDICRTYAQRFGNSAIRNLYLHGAPGLGKTFLSACIAREVSEQGYSVVYDTAANIFAQFEDRKFLRNADNQQARDETYRYLHCDLLILDDLGSELTTQFTQTALYELINARLVAGRHTVISSNLSLPEVAQRYSPQISSRLGGEYHDLWFFGQDIRALKKQG